MSDDTPDRFNLCMFYLSMAVYALIGRIDARFFWRAAQIGKVKAAKELYQEDPRND